MRGEAIKLAITAALALLVAVPLFAADVVTDGNMELAGMTNWPATNVAGANSHSKATDQKGGGAQSLKGVSAGGKGATLTWYYQQSLGAITGGQAVNLSLWCGRQHVTSAAGGNITLQVNVRRDNGAWTTIWTSGALTGSTTFQSSTVAPQDVSSSFLTSGSYDLQLYVTGKTGNTNGATFIAWWDNVVLDVTASNTAPSVAITAPTNNSVVQQGAPVTFTGTAADAQDGNLATSLSWTSSINGAIGSGGSFSTSTLSAGTHTITASVTDSGGLAGSAQITLIVNAPPSVTITAPSNNSVHTQGNSVTFTGTASDPEDGNISGNIAWSSSLNGSLGTGASVSSSTLSVGTHTITASITDSRGKTVTTTITIRINAKPVVTITAPANGATFAMGANVTFTGTATDAENGSLTSSLSWNSAIDGAIGTGGSFSKSNLSAGTHTITASVTDSDGAAGQAQISITIQENRVTPGSPTASASSCSQVVVSAPFTGDSNGNSTTTVKRGTAAGGPFGTTVCSGLTGASPRICTDNTASPSTNYYYEVTLADADGVLGTNPRVTGSVATPACGAPNPTTPAAVTAVISSCRQITVTAPFTGDGDADGWMAVEYNTTNTWPGTVACAKVMGSAPRQCLVTGLSPSTTYYTRTTFTDADGLAGALTSPQLTGPHALTACGSDAVPPTITIMAPARDAVVGGTEKVKVAVWDAGTLAATNPVQWAIDGGTFSTTATASTRYSCGTGCTVYEFAWDTTALAVGDHSITVKVLDVAGNDARVSWNVSVKNTSGAPSGGGTLLRRTHGSQLCVDCHALLSHSSQQTSTKYGNWSVDCLTCHTPHKTTNIFLVREAIRTINSGFKSIVFRQDDRAGGTNPNLSYLGDSAGTVYDDGVCEACHTKTDHYRNDTSGGDHTHNQAARCVGCHKHTEGFKGAGCDGCHKGPPTTGKHTTHDGSGVVPSSYTDLVGNRAATQYGFGCAKCHSGTHVNDTHSGAIGDPYQVEVAFDSTADPKNPGAAYAQKYPDATDQGNDLTKYWSWTSSIAGTDGNCTNSYCHSNAAPVGGTNLFATVKWNQAAALDCTSCHATGGAASTLSAAHRVHTDLAKYNYGCVRCHVATVSDNSTISNKANHVDGLRTLSFDSAGVNNSGGAYAQAPSYNCSNTYCHSNGQDRTAPYASGPSIAWNATSSADCSSCHGGNATAAVKMGPSNDHAAHMDQSGYLGTNIACGRCHNATVAPTNDRAVTTWASHVNGTADVSMVNVDLSAAGTYGGASTKTCTNSYCHSDGTETPTYFNTSLDWDGGFAKANDCKACHGTEAGSVAGEPRYTNNTGSFDTRNSHAAHVLAAADCIDCHAGTVTAAGALITAGTLHLNKTVEVSGGRIGSYTDATETCNSVGCHGGNSPQWGATLVCLNCHTGATDGGTLGDGTPNAVNNQWSTSGHGSAAGGALASAKGGCDYCHELAASHTPTAATNPYRLRFSATDNTLCLKCHLTGDAGINVNSAGTALTLENASNENNVDTAHFGAKHQVGEGGKLCWDCHDPHGVTGNILMIKTSVSITSSTYGVPATTGPVSFTARAAASDFVKSTGTPRPGICQACHNPSKGTDATTGSVKYWRWDGTDLGGGASSHNSTKVCTTCHFHTEGFTAAGGGDCRGCHGTGNQGPRRPVDADFSKQSHHVGSGSTMGGALTNYDCIVCHAEGYVDATAANAPNTNSNYHANGVIDLRNVDSLAMTASGTGSVFTFNKDSIGTTPDPATWNSANATWAAQMQNSMDPFCLACHDSNGASTAHVSTWDGTGTGSATNPFADGTVTNNYDQLSRGGVVDIKSRVAAGGTSLDKTGEARYDAAPVGDSIADPPQGIYSRHAIRGQSVSVYSGTSATFDTTTYWNRSRVAWASNSVMACADCHTNDGANTTSGNAHGSDSEYLLKDASGTATEGTHAGNSYNCYLCHEVTAYSTGHTGNDGDYTDYTALVGAARVPVGNTGGNRYAMACTNCHGGGYETKGDTTAQFGTIHGTSQVMAVGQDGGAGTRQAYRFTNGNSMRYYDPAGWDGGGTTCYTLSASDSFGGCTKHSKGQGYTPPAGARGLKY